MTEERLNQTEDNQASRGGYEAPELREIGGVQEVFLGLPGGIYFDPGVLNVVWID